MLRFLPVLNVACLLIAVPAAAQTAGQTPASASAQPASGSTSASQPPPAPETPTRSLFDTTWHQFQFGGRFTSVDGDPARFQRYQDIRDGALFSDARYALEDPGGAWLLKTTADKVGWRDQRYSAEYERPGRFVISGLWDEIPQFYMR